MKIYTKLDILHWRW